MREIIGMITLCGIGCFCATFNLPATLRAANSIYVRPCIVTDCGEGYVTVEYGDNIFEFEGDDFRIGQVLRVTFADNNTPDVTDDTIIAAESETLRVGR